MSTATIIQGDARRLPLADQSVHCVVTSPPYFGLRDYGTAKWDGGDPRCDHQPPNDAPNGNRGQPQIHAGRHAGDCGKCGACRIDSQIGLEPTPDEFVAAMVQVFREVRRVLRDDGTAWVNLGDTYNSSPSNQQGREGTSSGLIGPKCAVNGISGNGRQKREIPGLKPKDLLGIPWRVAFALQADGWHLRSDIIWAKPNPMPESVRDRPTKSHEHVFLLSKRERYFYDADAVREKLTSSTIDREQYGRPRDVENVKGKLNRWGGDTREGNAASNPAGRNLRDVWTIPTEAYRGAHFATFPRRLVMPCIKAGCPKGGTVLDPFTGSGTTGVVAVALNRRYVGVELNPKYARMALRRISRPHARHHEPKDKPLPLFSGIAE